MRHCFTLRLDPEVYAVLKLAADTPPRVSMNQLIVRAAHTYGKRKIERYRKEISKEEGETLMV